MNLLDQIAFEHAPIGLVLTEHRIVKSCNQSFAEMLGYKKEEIIEQSFRMFYPTIREFENIGPIGLEPLKQTGVYSDERFMTRKDGAQIWCRFRAQTLTRNRPLAQTVLSYALISKANRSVSFTAREREVISQLSRGLTSKEIARVLDVSHRTIEDVRQRLLKKLNVKNAAELLAHLSHIPH